MFVNIHLHVWIIRRKNILPLHKTSITWCAHYQISRHTQLNYGTKALTFLYCYFNKGKNNGVFVRVWSFEKILDSFDNLPVHRVNHIHPKEKLWTLNDHNSILLIFFALLLVHFGIQAYPKVKKIKNNNNILKLNKWKRKIIQ